MKIQPAKDKPKSAHHLFDRKRMEWPDSAEKVKVKLGSNSAVSDYFHTIDGTEEPELFLLWLQDF